MSGRSHETQKLAFGKGGLESRQSPQLPGTTRRIRDGAIVPSWCTCQWEWWPPFLCPKLYSSPPVGFQRVSFGVARFVPGASWNSCLCPNVVGDLARKGMADKETGGLLHGKDNAHEKQSMHESPTVCM